MKIDGYPVLAEFISEEADQEVIKKSEELQYFSQSARIQNAAVHFVRAIERLLKQVFSSAHFSYMHRNQ